jgi:hypothetical protein
MGRSIPSFRHLIEIERLNWSEFKKELSTKNEKEGFDTIFENAKLYTQYLSNANRPIPIEAIMMGALFHNYITLLKLNNQSRLSEDKILQEVAVLEKEKPLTKALFDKTCDRWRGLIYALHKDEREQLLRMLVDCCNSLNDVVAKMLLDRVSESNISVLFLFCLVLQNQNLINRINKSMKKNTQDCISLLDFINEP